MQLHADQMLPLHFVHDLAGLPSQLPHSHHCLTSMSAGCYSVTRLLQEAYLLYDYVSAHDQAAGPDALWYLCCRTTEYPYVHTHLWGLSTLGSLLLIHCHLGFSGSHRKHCTGVLL